MALSPTTFCPWRHPAQLRHHRPGFCHGCRCGKRARPSWGAGGGSVKLHSSCAYVRLPTLAGPETAHTCLVLSIWWPRQGCCSTRSCRAPSTGALAGALSSAVSCGSSLASGPAALWAPAAATPANRATSIAPETRGRQGGRAREAPAQAPVQGRASAGAPAPMGT